MKDNPHLTKRTFPQSILYYQFNNKFDVPKCQIHCSIYTTDWNFTRDPSTDLLIAFYTSIFKEHFKPTLYLAEMANLGFAFTFASNLISLKFTGYNETLNHLVEEFFKNLMSFKPSKFESMFKDKYVEMVKTLDNFEKNEPYQISGVYKLACF